MKIAEQTTSVEAKQPTDLFRRRLGPHAFAFFLLWPTVSVASAIINLYAFQDVYSVTHGAFNARLVPAALSALFCLFPEFMATATLGWIASVAAFGIMEQWLVRGSGGIYNRSRVQLFFEPILLGMAGVAGIAWEYPTVLQHPLLFAIRRLPVFWAAFLLTAIVLLAFAGLGSFQKKVRYVSAMTAVGIVTTLVAWRISFIPHFRSNDSPPRNSLVLLGIDSLSQEDDVSILRQTVAQYGGRWYENPVTPSLYTNAVWTSIFSHRSPPETGIFFGWQTVNWRGAPFNLVLSAKQNGYVTWSYFCKQITTDFGSNVGFDFNQGGPLGWRHLAAVSLRNGSLFLPIVIPRLTHIPFAQVSPNLSGTFAYDLDEDIRSILTLGLDSQKNLVAGHLEYLHDSQYPPMRALSREERARVWRTPAGDLQDSSLNWEYPVLPGEPLGIYEWKIRYLQKILAEELRKTRYLAAENQNRMILFSDHGNRRYALKNFCLPQCRRVILAAFGAPPADTTAPVSLIDISAMAGFRDPDHPAPSDPAVYFTGASDTQEWMKMFRTSTLRLNGQVVLGDETLGMLAKHLIGCRPYSRGRIFFKIPS